MSGNDRGIKKDNKTFSKNLLYLPLAAYDATITATGTKSRSQDADQNHSNAAALGDPHAYMASRKSLPKSVVEKSLIDFWHKVGVEYHRNQATVHDSKNNGSRPISASEMDERIRQRALTLVGGGINTTKSSTSDWRDNENKKWTRKRKQQQMDAMNFEIDNDNIIVFLERLNGLWNDYIVELLQLQSLESLQQYQALTKGVNFWARVTSAMTHETAQLVGAKVRIKACHQQRHLEGMRGILMGITKNTWTIIMQRRSSTAKKQKLHKQAEEKRSIENESAVASKKSAVVWKSMVVPKHGSILSILIPIKIKDACESSAEASTTREPLLLIDLREDP